MSYFDLEKLIEKYKIPWKDKKCCVCINGERNIGKTTNILKWCFDINTVDENNKIAFIRNADNQREMFARDFNSRMKNRYRIQGDFIYKLHPVEINRKDGTTEIHYKVGEHIGYNCAISTFLTMKSIESQNLRYIIFDEYNEKTSATSDLYVKFVNLFTTLERNNKLFFIMMGNRDAPNNEFMVKWEILPEKEIPKEDVVYELCNNDNWFHLFIELGTEQFKDLENDKTLSYYLSTYDKTAFNYRQGGYANPVHFRVVPYNKVIKPNLKTIYQGLAIDDKIVGLCGIEIDGKESLALVCNDDIVEKLYSENYEIWCLDAKSHKDGNALMVDNDAILGVFQKLLLEHRKNNVYYDSYEILNIMEIRYATGLFL